jgi:hypothetical protein
MVLIFIVSWRQAGVSGTSKNQISVATRAALITAIVGGMSGEYYYGGVGVLVLFATLAIAGSLPAVEVVFIADKMRSQIVRFRRAAS